MKTLAGGSILMLAFAMMASFPCGGAVITFDDLVSGQTSYGFDGDGDAINDVIFSTSDPLGFNTIGPGANQLYIQEPGLEGTSLLNPDLRVDFLNGAVGSITFGFALNALQESPSVLTQFRLYNSSNVLLAEESVLAQYTSTPSGTSSFPEGLIIASFSGIAAYGLFDFQSPSRYIIDNLEGTFGSTEEIVPEPSSFALIGLGIGAFAFLRRRLQ